MELLRRSFAHKSLERFYRTGSISDIQAKHTTRLRLILSNLDQAEGPEDMDLVGLELHKLKGNRESVWAVKINGNWRMRLGDAKRIVDTIFVLHFFSAFLTGQIMKNVTITLKPDVARWIRIKAAEREMSVSRYVGELLKDKMAEDDHYEQAMHQYFSLSPKPLGNPDEPLPKREELYDRPILRRY